MLRILTLLALLVLPTMAQSGAWLQEKSAVFLSWSNSISTLPETRYATDTSLYAEYGLTPRLTVGFDGYLVASGSVSEAYLFIRHPIGKTDRPARVAVTFGAGIKSIPNPWGTTTQQALVKIGVSWGRGLKNGWLSVDASAATVISTSLDVPGQSGTSYSADFTWGMKPTDRLMLIWQLQTGKTVNGPTYAKFAPSLVWSIGGGSNKIEIGFVKGLSGDDTQSLKLGFWKSF